MSTWRSSPCPRPRDAVTALVLGAGTVGFWLTRTIFSSAAAFPKRGEAALAVRINHLLICDRARIGATSGVTCPDYAGEEVRGAWKCERLGELVGEWCGRSGPAVETFAGAVEDLGWDRLAPASPGPDGGVHAPGGMLLVFVGLDRWSSWLAAVEDSRRFAARFERVLLVQIGLDRGQASLAVLGSEWEDPCPACGLAYLPDPESCVAYTTDRRLLRGNLHAEACAAAEVAVEIAGAFLDGDEELRNRKMYLFQRPAVYSGGEPERSRLGFQRFQIPARRFAECCGPHSPHTPLRWEGVLEPFERRLR